MIEDTRDEKEATGSRDHKNGDDVHNSVEREKDIHFYRSLVLREEKRLKSLCQIWNEFGDEPEFDEKGLQHIKSATNQVNQLLEDCFMIFSPLVASCEKEEGLFRCEDLSGIWERIEKKIARCDLSFSRLHSLKVNNWIDKDTLPTDKDLEKKSEKCEKTTAGVPTTSKKTNVPVYEYNPQKYLRPDEVMCLDIEAFQ